MTAMSANPHRYCAQVMLEALKGEQGIIAAHLDTRSSTLTLDYDPSLSTPERVTHLASEVELDLRDNYETCTFHRDGMSCDECLARFEGHRMAASAHIPSAVIESHEGVLSLTLPSKGAPARIERVRHKLGYHIETAKDAGQFLHRERLESVLVVTTLVALVGGVLARHLGAPSALETALAGLAYASGSFFGILDGFQTIRAFKLDVNFLMIVAAIGAALIGSWPEGATLLFLFSLSNLLQNFAMGRSRNAIRKLLDLRPATALVRRDGEEIEVLVETLEVGETVIIKPGNRIPVDGVVTGGQSSVDQSSLTGESVPVDKAPGDKVFAGTVNQHGALDVRVTKQAQDTTLARIIKLVEEAQEERAPTQRFLEAFEQYYTIGVIGAVALFILIPVLLLGQPFQPTFYKGMVLLVVASPCALVISTPASILSAIANAARKGILFKGGAHLENAAMLKVVAFDKTGTLTFGKPKVTDVVAVNGYSESDLLALSAAVEARSEHPLAKAVVEEAEARGLTIPVASDFQAYPGMGVRARVDGAELVVGSRRLMEEQGYPVNSEMIGHIRRLEGEGKTVLLVHNHTCVGAIAVADEVRPTASQTIEALKAGGIKRVVMLTGDNERVAQAIAARLGVDEFYAALMPEEKVRVLKELEARHGPVAMIGDGVNDAPALAAASIGVAMGAAGTDVALETADVVLMADDLAKLPYVIELSRRARRIVWQNIAFSIAVIATLVISTFGLFGPTLPLPLGVVGHEGSTVLVVFNGLRLLAFDSHT